MTGAGVRPRARARAGARTGSRAGARVGAGAGDRARMKPVCVGIEVELFLELFGQHVAETLFLGVYGFCDTFGD